MPLLLTVFGDQARHIVFRETERTGALFSVGVNLVPFPIFQLTLYRIVQQFTSWAVFFISRRLYLRKERRRYLQGIVVAGYLHAASVRRMLSFVKPLRDSPARSARKSSTDT